MARIDWRKHFESTEDTLHGILRACGTRVPVTVILDSLADGMTVDEILQGYPSLQREHIDAAIAYAAELAQEQTILPSAAVQ